MSSLKLLAWLAPALPLLVAAPALAQDASAEGEPQLDVQRVYTPLSAERFDQMIPKHPGYLGALAPENLAKPRPKPPFEVTGTWFIDLREGFLKFLFGPPYPKFGPEGRQALREYAEAQREGRTYRDVIGQCYPPGMPMIMTRVWPHAFIQLPTAIYMISGFNNSVRTIFLDGRQPSDPDLVVPSYNGESIGTWEGDTLVVRSKYFEPDNHYIDYGIPIDDNFEMVERIRLLEDGKVMEITYIMTDPTKWEGEWTSTKRFLRADYTDINESQCITGYNANLPGTDLGNATAEARGQSDVEGVREGE
ncbi:MAG: hypothetical protein B7Z08_08560 [Sphingomonadales bacterium 32-68-7]|nr:MAG: hypothetical protein B7Z33_09435 [Sphingomonadales bacterium 12-68-11]OYX08678.1 MAG: hypothetical protein B7Z08_08560 [Sphingomonadales bacterium 32-68-7]